MATTTTRAVTTATTSLSSTIRSTSTSTSLASSFGSSTGTGSTIDLSTVFSASTTSFPAISTFSPGVTTTIFPFSSSTTQVNNAFPSSASANANGTLVPPFASPQGPPYIQAQALGGIPSRNPDLAASILTLVLFFIGFLAHIWLFKHNKSRGRFFPMAIGVGMFCLLRIITLALRLGWTSDPNDVHVALTASIFVAAGTVILYIVNGVCAMRIVRTQHQNFGDSRGFKVIVRFLLFSVILTLLFLIIAGIQAAYTTNRNTRLIDRGFQLYGVTFFVIIAFLPIPVVLLSQLTDRGSAGKYGGVITKQRFIIVMSAASFLTFRAVWICAAMWQPVAPPNQPLRWYFRKPAFYLVSLLPELIVVYLFALLRFDRHFYVNRLGVFEGLDSERTTPRNNITVLRSPPAPRVRSDAKTDVSYDEESLEYNKSMNDYYSYQSRNSRYQSGSRVFSPISEERMPYEKPSMTQKNSRESLKHSPNAYHETSAKDFPFPPASARTSRGPMLSVITSYPDQNGGRGHSMMFGRNSIAIDPNTGHFHFVSAPLVPAAFAGNGHPMSMAFPDNSSSIYFDPAFDPMAWAGSVHQSRASPINVPSPANGYPGYTMPVYPQMAHISTPPPPMPQPLQPHAMGSPPKEPLQPQAQPQMQPQAQAAMQPPQRPRSTSPPAPIIPVTAPLGSNPNPNPPLFRPGSMHTRRRSLSANRLNTLAEDESSEGQSQMRSSSADRASRPPLQRMSRSNIEGKKRMSSWVAGSTVPSMSGLSMMTDASGMPLKPNWWKDLKDEAASPI